MSFILESSLLLGALCVFRQNSKIDHMPQWSIAVFMSPQNNQQYTIVVCNSSFANEYHSLVIAQFIPDRP